MAGDGGQQQDGDGYSYKTTKPGNATNFPKTGHTVSVHYVGRLAENNSIFDSSRSRKKPFHCKVGVGQMIRAWEEVLPRMSVGQKVEITVQPEFGYGIHGYPPVIPANAVLLYELELLSYS